MLTLAKSPRLSLKKASHAQHVTLAQVYASLKDMRRYTLRANYRGRKQVLNLDLMTYKQAMIMRSKHSHYPHLSIEIVRCFGV